MSLVLSYNIRIWKLEMDKKSNDLLNILLRIFLDKLTIMFTIIISRRTGKLYIIINEYACVFLFFFIIVLFMKILWLIVFIHIKHQINWYWWYTNTEKTFFGYRIAWKFLFTSYHLFLLSLAYYQIFFFQNNVTIFTNFLAFF